MDAPRTLDAATKMETKPEIVLNDMPIYVKYPFLLFERHRTIGDPVISTNLIVWDNFYFKKMTAMRNAVMVDAIVTLMVFCMMVLAQESRGCGGQGEMVLAQAASPAL